MAEGESIQHNSEKGDDSRITEVRRELSETAKLMTDPRLLRYSSEAEKSPYLVEYESDDTLKFARVQGRKSPQHIDYNSDNFPKQLKQYERIIQILLMKGEEPDTPIGNLEMISPLWVNLESNDLTIYQAVEKNGKPPKRLSGNEKVVERPDLLPDLLDAVSGHKNTFKDQNAWASHHLKKYKDEGF